MNVESVLLVPHSNQAVVATAFGFTDPFNMAADEPTLVAVLLMTVGRVEPVVKVKMLAR